MTLTTNTGAGAEAASVSHQLAGDDRFYVESRERPKKKELDAHGYTVPLTKCQGVLAIMYGFRNLNELFDHVGHFGRSPGDEDVDQATFERRFDYQVQQLIQIGVVPSEAEEIIDWVRPTGIHPSHARWTRPVSRNLSAGFDIR